MACFEATPVNGSRSQFTDTADCRRRPDQRCHSERSEESFPWLPKSLKCPVTGCGRLAFDCVVAALRGRRCCRKAATERCNYGGERFPTLLTALLVPASNRVFLPGADRRASPTKGDPSLRSGWGRARMTSGRRDRACEGLLHQVFDGLEREPPLPVSVGVASEASPVMA